MSAVGGVGTVARSAVLPPMRRLRTPIVLKMSTSGLLSGGKTYFPPGFGRTREISKLKPPQSSGMGASGDLVSTVTVTGEAAREARANNKVRMKFFMDVSSISPSPRTRGEGRGEGSSSEISHLKFQ